jgi:lysophospholipase
VTFSSIQLDQNFTSGQIPMPIIVADGRAPGETIIPVNTTVYEFSPFEFGSWDPTTYAFAPLRYLGSNFTNGTIGDDQDCISGFDNAGFVMGTSSSLFNSGLTTLNLTGSGVLTTAITAILGGLSADNDDIADYQPNPFYGFNGGVALNTRTKNLTLVDGGEDGENIPLHPLIQPFREVDVIFAVDSSADTTNNWPNGTSLVASYQRSLNPQYGNGTAFPAVPDQNTFVNLGFNKRPTFFGCDATNQTGPTPLIVYIPNSPYSFLSNFTTLNLDINDTSRDAIILNGYNVATQANSTEDADWPACVGCAIISRSLNKTGTAVPDICKTCFSKYCWDGTVNSTTPAAYEPAGLLSQTDVSGAATLAAKHLPSLLVAAAVGMIVLW